MNFDFLKGLQGLGYVYENCSNAEKLAMTMPVQSVFTSRKSAEQLAKFIYLAAHNQEMEGLSFADILADFTVRKFVGSRDVMDAFHDIRKSGNRAVHEDGEETSEDAVAVLHDLHYVAGETARMLGLIEDYPGFEDQLESFPEAKFVSIEDVNEKAQEMFLEYIKEHNAQQERDQYVELDLNELFLYTIKGNVEMHEYLEFKHKPKQMEIIEYLQKYLATLLRLSIARSPEKASELKISYPVTLDANIIIDGVTYSSRNMESFVEALNNILPNSNGFVIDIFCNGILREFFAEESAEDDIILMNMIRKDAAWTGGGMLNTLRKYKRRNTFEYKLSVFYPDSGEFKYEKISKGKEVDVLSTCTEDIVDQEFDESWWSRNLVLCAQFDFEKHNDILLKLQEIVKTSIPADELSYCEDGWGEGDLQLLCNDIQWNCACLREVQNFLDKINEVLLPIKDEVDAYGTGTWEIRNRFAVATWDWTDQGFKITGTVF